MESSSNAKTANKIKEKNIHSQQQIDKYQLNIKKRNANIEKKFIKSTVNKLYIFPRLVSLDVSVSSSSSQEDIELQYNLKAQNVKSRKNQTKMVQTMLDIREGAKLKQYESVRSYKSIHSVEQGGKTLKNKTKKSKNIEISFNTKKKNTSQTKTNSQRKLFAEQYSLENRIYATTKDSTNRFVVSFRDNKKHEINISLSGRKMKTEIN